MCCDYVKASLPVVLDLGISTGLHALVVSIPKSFVTPVKSAAIYGAAFSAIRWSLNSIGEIKYKIHEAATFKKVAAYGCSFFLSAFTSWGCTLGVLKLADSTSTISLIEVLFLSGGVVTFMSGGKVIGKGIYDAIRNSRLVGQNILINQDQAMEAFYYQHHQTMEAFYYQHHQTMEAFYYQHHIDRVDSPSTTVDRGDSHTVDL